MIRVLIAFLVLTAAAGAFIAPVGPNQIEGPNVPDQPYVAYSGHNCAPQPGETFAKCLAFVRGPGDSTGEPPNPRAGTQAYSACQWHIGDPLPSLPDGYWSVGASVCPAPDGANCTDAILGLRSWFVDGGCWAVDSASGAFLSAAIMPRPTLRRGRCSYHHGRAPRCHWKDKAVR